MVRDRRVLHTRPGRRRCCDRACYGPPGSHRHHARYRLDTDFAVDDFDATLARLRTLNVEFERPEEGADEGYRLARVRDPEGNAIGLSE